MNIKKFELFNRVLSNQLDRQVSAFLKRDYEREQQAKLDSIVTIEILKEILDEHLNKTNEMICKQAELIFI